MPPLSILAVLCGALLHASWNALVKAAPDKMFNMGLVSGGAGIIGALLLCLHLPAPASWPFIAASGSLTAVYYVLLILVYGRLDMSQAYPLMRGTAPFLVALASGPLIGQTLPAGGWIGVLLICCGVLTLSFVGKAQLAKPHLGKGDGRLSASSLGFIMGIAAIIAICTLLDSVGGRLAGQPLCYTAAVYVIAAAPLPVWLLARRSGFIAYAWRYWYVGALGGAGTLMSYSLALWAMTEAPVAAVAALRESSILFASAISALFLHERVGWRRAIASSVIAAGVAVIKFA